MKTITLAAAPAARTFSQTIDLAHRGDRVVITHGGKSRAVIYGIDSDPQADPAAIDWANESGLPCVCELPRWSRGGIDDSGKCLCTDGPVHWFEGYVICECGHRVEFSDSD